MLASGYEPRGITYEVPYHVLAWSTRVKNANFLFFNNVNISFLKFNSYSPCLYSCLMTKISEATKERMMEQLEQIISDIHDMSTGWDVELPKEMMAAFDDAKAALGRAEDLLQDEGL